MPLLPEVAEEAVGEVPEVPERTITDEAGAAHTGCVAVAVRDDVEVRDWEELGVAVTVAVGVPLVLRDAEGLLVAERVAELLGVLVRVAEPLGVEVRVPEGLGVPVPLDVADALRVFELEPEVERVGEAVAGAVAETEVVGVGAGVAAAVKEYDTGGVPTPEAEDDEELVDVAGAVALELRDCKGELVGGAERDVELLGVSVALMDALTVAAEVTDSVDDPVATGEQLSVEALLGVGELVGAAVLVDDAAGLSVLDMVVLALGVAADERLAVVVQEGNAVDVGLGVPLLLDQGAAELEPEQVPELEPEGVFVLAPEAVDELELEGVAAEESVLVLAGEGELEHEGVPVVEAELVGVVELEAVWAALLDVEAAGVVLPEGVAVGAGEALRRLAMLRPRKVMEETAASAPPRSHSVDS